MLMESSGQLGSSRSFIGLWFVMILPKFMLLVILIGNSYELKVQSLIQRLLDFIQNKKAHLVIS